MTDNDIVRRVLMRIDEYEEVAESNTTSNGGEYNSKFAFSSGTEETDNERTRQGDRCSGFPNKTTKTKNNFEVFERWEKQINEVTMAGLKDSSESGKRELNKYVDNIYSHISAIKKSISVMERHMKNKNLTPANIWNSKMDKVYKIDEWLIHLGQKFRNMGF